MLKDIGEFFGTIRDVWSEDASARQKLAIILALIVGPAVGALVVAGWYAKAGCAIHSTGALLVYGLGGLFLTFVFAVFVCLVIMSVLYIPEGIRGAVTGIQDWLASRRRQRKYNLEHGYKGGPDWDRVKWHLYFWPVLLAVIGGLSLTLGWIVWHFVC